MAWDFPVQAPGAPSYPSPNPFYVGNALSNLVSNYQQAQQGQQATQQNNLRLQQDQQLLDQSKAFAGGVPTNPDGTTNYFAVMNKLAELGDTNAISQFSPLIQNQQWQKDAASAPNLWGGGGSSGGSGSKTADAIPSDGSAADTLADNLATRIESKGQSDPYDVLGPITKSGDRAYGKYQVMGDNIPSWTKEILGEEMTPDEFLADPKAQDEVARAKLGQYIKQTGSPQDAASMWLTGKPLAQGANIADQNGMTGARYADIATAGMGGGGGSKVAPDASEAPAYASPDKPSIPPVSAAAGSSIPRENATTAVGAVGGAPQQTQGGPLAANNPAWAGLNASLPVGPNGAPAQAPSAPAPRAPAQSPAGSVASIASAAGIPPQVTANIAKAVGAAPDAPLTPQQAQRAKTIVQNYKQRNPQQVAQQQQQQTAPQGQPQQGQPAQGGGPIIPQFQLPPGAKNPQDGILMLDKRIADIARSGNPYLMKQIPAYEDWRYRIAKSSAPMEVHPGTSFVDPVTGRTLYQGQTPATARMQMLQDKADNIADAIKSGDQPPVLTGLYGAGPLVRSSLEKDGVDVSKLQLQWDAAKKQVQSLNGPQMIRFTGLANSVVNTIDEVKDLSDQMQNSGVPLLNKAKMSAYINAEGNSENGQLATRYMTAVNTLKEEFAGLAQGGYAPTESAWKLADQQINGDYGVKQLGASLSEVQRLIKYRLNAMPGMSSVGPGSANQYMPGGGGQAAPQGQPQSAGGLPAGWSVEVH